jgi:tRNA A-37 threonylcarbamoyl transferase component Bud32
MYLDRVIAVRNNKSVYRNGDKCIKVFHADCSKADVLNEALNQARAEEMGICVPKVLEVTEIEGKWAIVFEFVKGKTLDRLIYEDPQKKHKYIELLVDIQDSLHAKNCPFLSGQKDQLLFKISASGLDVDIRSALCSRLEAMPSDNKLCHGDINFTNVLIDDGGLPVIVDWFCATRGNALADIATSYLLLLKNEDVSGAELYLDTVCRKKHVESQDVLEWVPIIAASRLASGNEYEREFLKPWIFKNI